MRTTGANGQASPRRNQIEGLSRLYFDSETPLRVQAHLGETAYLSCRLRSFQQRELNVSWIRNIQILTSGELRYTSDERFNPVFLPNKLDWVLEIRNVSESDEGPYECQVNSDPKPAVLTIHLEMVKAQIEIIEAPRLDLDEGEEIKLTCRVEFSRSRSSLIPEGDVNVSLGNSNDTTQMTALDDSTAAKRQPAVSSQVLSYKYYIYWFKGNLSLEYSNPRRGVKVEQNILGDGDRKIIESSLVIEDATKSDSGLYICKIFPQLNGVQPSEVRVSVGGESSDFVSSMTRLVSNGSDICTAKCTICCMLLIELAIIHVILQW